MSLRSDLRRAVLAGFCLCATLCAQAAPKEVERFEAQTWADWHSTLPRPAVVVFSTTDCSHCPHTIDALGTALAQHRPRVPLIVVVMDGEGEADLLRTPHYQKATRLFAFHGPAAALQYRINPDWRGMTPFVALWPKTGEPQFVLGTPSSEQLRGMLHARTGN